MARPSPRNKPPHARQSFDRDRSVVRRKDGPRQSLPPEFEALARGEERLFPRKDRRNRLPEKPGLQILGVTNRDARVVHDLYVTRIRSALEALPDEAILLEELLLATVKLRLWRGKNITSFDAFIDSLFGMDPKRAREMVHRGAARIGVKAEPLDDLTAAAWIRIEAAMQRDEVDGRVTVGAENGAERVVLHIDPKRLLEGLAGISRHLRALTPRDEGHFSRERPRTDRDAADPRRRKQSHQK